MNIAFRAKNFVLAAHLAKRIITGVWSQSGDQQLVNSTTLRARKVLAASEEKGTDEFKINFDPSWLHAPGETLRVCAGYLAPVHASLHEQMVCCPFCKSCFHPDWTGKVCSVCQLSAVGATALGLQFLPL
jgi:coatomer protein complex subunit alpha (xenin)